MFCFCGCDAAQCRVRRRRPTSSERNSLRPFRPRSQTPSAKGSCVPAHPTTRAVHMLGTICQGSEARLGCCTGHLGRAGGGFPACSCAGIVLALRHRVRHLFLLCCSAVFPPIPEHDKWKPSPTDFEADGARIEGAFREHIHRSEAGQDQNTVEVCVRNTSACQLYNAAAVATCCPSNSLAARATR